MNPEEFKEHILSVRNKLFRLALRILGNPAEAEDVVQEVFIKIWNNREKLQHVNNREAWSMKLAKNQAIDKLRSKHKRTRRLEEGGDFSDNGASPYQLTEGKDTMKQIELLMAQLPENQMLVMQLRDIEGLAYREIAETLDMTLNQVKINLFRARKSIGSKLIKSKLYG